MTDVGLDTATDYEIWVYAGENGFVIVSRDSDFRQLAFLCGAPPKVVWLRLGNATMKESLEVLLANLDLIAGFVDDDEEALLIIGSQEMG